MGVRGGAKRSEVSVFVGFVTFAHALFHGGIIGGDSLLPVFGEPSPGPDGQCRRKVYLDWSAGKDHGRHVPSFGNDAALAGEFLLLKGEIVAHRRNAGHE